MGSPPERPTLNLLVVTKIRSERARIPVEATSPSEVLAQEGIGK